MINRQITGLIDLVKRITITIVNIVIPKEKNVEFLESLGASGLFENIPPAENFDFETGKIKAIFCYKTSLCRQAIWEIKYRANSKLIRDFSLLLYEYILEDLADLETFNNFKNIVLIPIPSTKARTCKKGFNQCVLLSRELLKIDKERKGENFILNEKFLEKSIDTPHQTKVSNRKKRLENLQGSFSVNEKARLDLSLALEGESLSYFIIDDVITTGATMREAFRALKSAGIPLHKIRGYALAH